MHITPRHTSSRPDSVQEEFDYLLNRDKQFFINEFLNLCQDPHSFGLRMISKDSLKVVYWSELARRPASDSYSFLFYAHQFGYNSCLLRYHQEVELTFGKTKVSTNGDNTKPRLPVEYLTNLPDCIYLSLILRDKAAQLFYGGVELHPHENKMYGWRSPFVQDMLLQAVCQGSATQALAQVAFARAFEEREMQKALARNYVLEDDFQLDEANNYATGFPCTDWEKEMSQALKLPMMVVLESIYRNDEKQFNKALLSALGQHKTYYESRDEYNESRTGLPEGWVSLALTAACALAHDRGMKREVESDYIPEWMVKGEFEGLALVVE